MADGRGEAESRPRAERDEEGGRGDSGDKRLGGLSKEFGFET